MKKLAALLTIALTSAAFQARALNPGDIAFTGFNADGNDDLAFVTLVEIPAATEIHFSDNEWNGSAIGSGGAFNTGEGTYTWTATATVPAGSVVTLDSLGTASPASNLGTVAIVSGSLNLGASNEAVHAYQGTPTVPTVFLTAFGNDTPSAAGTDLTGTGLTEGVNAFFITGDADGFRYKGPRIGQLTFAAYLPLIADTATNWDVEASDGTLYLPFDTTAFTIAASSEVSIADASVSEGDAGTVLLEFTVSRTDPASEFSVDVAVTGGSALAGTDFVNPGTVTLNFTAAGVNSQTASVTVNSDTELEIDETVEVTLSNVVNTTGTTTIASGSAVGTITNDDFLPVTYPPSNAFSFSAKGAISERSAGVPLAGAEIPAFDPVSKRAFLSSGTGVEVIDLTNPAAPTFVKNLDLTAAPYSLASNDVSSVAVKNGVLAAAVIASSKTGNGTVIFIDAATEALLGTASVGSVPDHVGFTPDGTKVLVAIEGELTDTADVNSNPATDTIPGGVAIIDVSGGFAAAPVTTAGFAAFDGDVAALRAAGVRIFDGGVPSTDFEPEYFAISPDSTTAVVTLQEANAVGLLDIATATFTSIRALGEKDFSGLMADFSDRDGAGAANLIKPTTGNPVFGLYMPDQIASFEANGQLYFITANEGDDRDDFLPVAETIRVGSGSYDLDDTVFPNEAALKNNANLGRLTVSNAPGLRGDTDATPDGDVDRILAYGGRSFSIWDTAGSLVYDSGDMLEMIVATQFPASFDDGRSDNKGPEPEGVTVAEVDGRTLAFVGLERSNMVVVFDVTNPLAPTYVTALQNAGDVSPEGLLTVSSADSPSGLPLVLVANEVSNSLTVYQLNPKLIITEVQSNQVVSGAGDYWELTNAGDTTVDLSNWSWDDNSIAAGTVMIPNGTMIAPGESVIFTGVAAETFRTRWNLPPSVQVITGAGAPGLGGGDGVYLFDADGTLITSFDFAAGNFTKVDGSPSLGGHAGPSAGGTLDAQAAVIDPFFGTGNPRYTFADGTTLGTFASTASPDELGSPGSAFLAPRLLVTEINSSGAPEDFWEVTNVGVAAVDLSGWSWDDDSAVPGTVVIPAMTSIAPGESIILTAADATAFRTQWSLPGTVQVITGAGAPGLGQNDQVFLFDADGNQVATFSYAAAGFTKSDGSPSAGGHAGLSAGGSSSAQSAILDPAFGTETPRYTFADGTTLGTTNPTGAVTGSPGSTGLTSGPTFNLTVTVAPATFSESAGNPAATGTVTRDGDTSAALTVTLSSSDETEATIPATVEILAGQASANFDVTAVDDTFPDGDQSVTITGTAAGATPGVSNTLTVQDDGDVLSINVMLTEVLSNQSSGAPSGAEDYWELTNFGGSAIDVSGYSWHDSGRSAATASAWALPPGTMIGAGESVIFTAADPAAFRAWWGIAPTVQVFQSVGAPGLGQGDGISFFDEGGNEIFFFSYDANGFTKEDGSPSTGGHAGISGGGTDAFQALIWVPTSGTSMPRYTAATGSNYASITAVSPATDKGSPGNQGVVVPTVAISNGSVTEGDTGTVVLALDVTRSDTDTDFSVDYAVSGGTATSGVDYVALASGTLTFNAAGAATQTLNINVNGDTDSEPDETIIVTLSNVVNTTGATIISTADGIGTIINDDAILPTITLEPAGTTIASGGVTTLRVAADGFPVPTLQWYQGSSGDTSMPVSGATSATFVTPALSSTTSFWARATNTAGSADSVAATVTVVPAITSVDLSQYVRVGRYDLPEPTRTALPAGTPAHNLLCQEASAVTYNWDTDTLFITGDGGRSITQVSKTGELIDTMTLALGSSPQGTDFYDPEGLTYIGGGQFVMSEERDRNLVKFTYVAGTTLNRAGAQTVNIGPFVDNTGTEGLSFDPLTGDFICLKEISPIGIFQTTVDFGAGTATNKATVGMESINLFDPALLGMSDVADVFALSNLSGMSGQTQEPFLIVIGQEDARVVNVDRSGNIQSTLQIVTDVGNPLSAGNQQHEGVTMDPAGNLYVVNENGGGDADHPQLWVYAPATAPNAAPTQVVLNNPINAIDENTSTASPIKVGEIVVVDDGLGTNDLSLSGADVAFFEISGADLLLKAGTVLDFETKPSYSIVIEADDTTVGTTPDVTANYTLTVNDLEPETPPLPALIISEVVPWGSSSPVGSDWFEVTNTSDNPVDITGWKMDDNSAVFANAVALNGITTIAAGESVIFIETDDLPGKSATFLSNWFGGSPPVGLQIGSYTGSGVGLSGNGDGVNLYNAAGVLQAGVTFGASPATAPFTTFDNTAGLNNAEITQFSAIGVNGAFAAANNANEIGSPGYAEPGLLRITEVAPWSSGNSPVVGADWFEVTNLGARAVDIRGWKVDDSSESPAAAVALVGIDTIAPGESVIFVESSTPATTVAAFVTNWFGGSAPSGLQIGTYTGSGIGLSTGGDAVNLYDTRTPTPARRASVNFGASPLAAPFATFDNAAGLDVATLSQLSAVGVNGAFAVAGGNEIGSPGRVVTPPFMLQILHASDLEGGVDAVSSAPGFAAMVDQLESTAAADGIGSILLSAGDNYIPGPFYNAAGDLAVFRTGGVFNDTYNTLFGETRYNALREGEGRVDISIMNVLGFDASAIGNHEFDNTSSFFELIIEEDFRSPNGPASDRWVGAQFPYLSANLDFSADAFLSDLYTPSILPNTAFATGPAQTDANITNVPKLASATTIDVGGRKVGVVGATTQLLTTISSPSGTVGKTPTVTDMSALAAVLQPVIDDVMNGDDNTPGNSDDVDIIVLVTHLQQIALEKALAPLLSGVDVIIAGGSDTLQANAGTYLRPGDVAAEAYPFQTTNLNSEPVMIVSTDGEYSYLGRLVAGFDANGVLIPSTVDPMVSGPYATDEFGVTSVTGEASLNDAIAASVKATEVKKLTDAVTGVIVAKDSVIHGYTDVYIEGRRQLVRTEETTMGNVTADANLTAARAADPTVAVSIKNGGGIRASIGEIDGFSGALLPPQGNPVASKPVGAVSQLDIENVMRFNNRLMVFETTPAGLKALIEHGVSATAPGATPGQFPQVGGMRFSFDPGLSAGSRVRSMVILDAAGNPVDRVVENGIVLGDPSRIIKVVTLNFLANGGDSYPFKANGDNFRYLLTDGSLSDVVPETNDFNTAPGNALGEQAAAAAWFTANHPAPGSAFNVAEVTPEFDTRIQFIGVRADTVLQGAPTLLADWLLANGYTSTSADSDGNGVPDVLEYFFDQSPNDPSDTGNLPRTVQEGGDLELRFRRQANAPDLTGILRWSTNLTQWFNAVLGVDYEVISEVLDGDVVEVRYRLLKGMDDFKFYRFEVTQSP